MNYELCIANFIRVIGGYTGIAYAKASLGNKYQVTSEDDIPTINPTSVGSTIEDQIILTNRTSPAVPITMGFTLCGNILTAEDNVGGNAFTIFKKSHTYYVAAYCNIRLGQLAPEDVNASIALAKEFTQEVMSHAI